MSDQPAYKLSEAQNEQIFREDILPKLLTKSVELHPSAKPTMIDAQKRESVITKTVEREIEKEPRCKELLQYIADREVTVLSAPETELKLSIGQLSSKNAGEI